MRSGDLVIAASARDRVIGEPEEYSTAEARRRGERSGDRNTNFTTGAYRRGHGNLRNLTTETRRHGEGCRNGNSSDPPITRDPPIPRSLTVQRWVYKVWHLVTAVLREIFDESAYDRFLARTQTLRSVESYREFMREREMTAARRPRCC